MTYIRKNTPSPRDRVTAMLKEHGPLTARQLAEKLCRDESHVRRLVAKLRDEGSIVVVKRDVAFNGRGQMLVYDLPKEVV